jgi:hypothetical protein
MRKHIYIIIAISIAAICARQVDPSPAPMPVYNGIGFPGTGGGYNKMEHTTAVGQPASRFNRRMHMRNFPLYPIKS